MDQARVTERLAAGPATGHVPEADLAVVASGGQQRAIGTEGDSLDPTWVGQYPLQAMNFPGPSPQVPTKRLFQVTDFSQPGCFQPARQPQQAIVDLPLFAQQKGAFQG